MLTLKGRTLRTLSAVAVLWFCCACALGDVIVWDFANPPAQGPTIQEVIDAGGIQVGDKLFDEFDVTTADTQGTVAPGADAIVLTGVQVQGDYGLRFNGGWSAGGQEIADTTILFQVSIVEPWLSQGFLIKDNALWITAFGVSGTGQGGIVSVSENVYALNPRTNPPKPPDDNMPLANKYVYYRSDTDMELYDSADFGMLTSMWVLKDVVANGGDLTTGSAHLSEFFQTFSQIPEPGTLGVLVLGAVAVLIRRRRLA